MSESKIKMPPVNVVAAILRETTQRLAWECVRPSAAAPAWNDVEWAVACAASAMQGISVLLANRVPWVGPPIWQAFLADQREQLRLRDVKIGKLLARLDEAMRVAGCGALALKGAALRRLDLYQPGERPMSDIDLLLDESAVVPVAGVLRGLDYIHSFNTSKHSVFEPRIQQPPNTFAEHADHPLKIEVHTKIAEALPLRHVDITVRLARRSFVGVGTYENTASLLLHTLLHAAGDMCRCSTRQIQLHDIGLLSSRMREPDWQAILAAHNGEPGWWLYPPLSMAARYYAEAVPADVLKAARSVCPRSLRRWVDRCALTDVSWSNLRLYAFPGIRWAGSPLEAIGFAWSRVFPSRTTAAENKAVLGRSARFRELDWYRVSRARRVFRWLTTSAPRAPPMWVVQAALQSAQRATDAQ